MSLPKRKPLRLSGWDYSDTGCYFITICTKDMQHILRRGAHCAPGPSYASVSTSQVLGRGAHCAPEPHFPPLSEIGETVEWAITEIPSHYQNVKVDKYVVMPNHIHLILVLGAGDGGRTMCAPTVSRIIHGMKEAVTKRIGQKIWQRGYYDHIIRDEADYLRIWQYIDANPAKWAEDEYYVP